MNKDANTPLRIFTMVAFALSCFGLLLFLWVAFGGAIPFKPKGYRVTMSFAEATQLAQEADVRISGVPVGKVKKLEPRDDGRTTAVVEIDSEYAPLAKDTRAILRQKTLLGETYVELTPGSSNGPKIPENGELGTAQVSETVELDEILRAFDKPTREAFKTWMLSQAEAFQGRGRDVNDALGNLAPFAEDARVLVRILNRQEGAVRRLISNTGVVFGALSERDGQLAELITNSNRVFETTAARDQELQDTFRILPTFARESRLTLDRLRTFADDTDPLITQLRPAARQLSPTLIDLTALAPDLRALFRDLDELIVASREGFPAAEQVLRDLRPLLEQVDPFVGELQPITDFLEPYKRELSAFFANVVAATQVTDLPPGAKSRVHYLRTTNPVNLENLANYPRRLGTNRNNPYTKPGVFEQLERNLPVYEDRHCGRGVPIVSQQITPLIGEDVAALLNNTLRPITEAVQGGDEAASGTAPRCVKQAPYQQGNVQRQYPQVERK